MTLFLDIETQALVPENRNLQGMRISIAGVRTGGVATIFPEDSIQALFPILDKADLIVGHNLLAFDYKILQHYAEFDVVARYRPKTFDFLHIIMRKTDRRVALNDLAQRNLAIAKLGAGKDAPLLFKEGKLDELQAYLAQDLLILEQLFEHVKIHGMLKYGHIIYKEPIEKELLLTPDER
jgi:hypothetical protein